MAKSDAAVLEQIRRSDFDVAAFVRDASGQGAERAARLTQQLEDCVAALDADLQREIAACHDELLQNASRVNGLGGQLGGIRAVVDSLLQSIAKVKVDVLVPFHGIKRRTLLLARMEAVGVLIRHLRHFLTAARKLRTQTDAPAKDLPKAAQTLQELEEVIKEGGLDRVDILCQELAFIRDAGARIRQQAALDLRTVAKQGNQTALSSGLQVFFNLNCLWPQLKRLLAEMLEELVQTPLPPGPNFQQALESNLQLFANQVHRTRLLDDAIRSKVDPLTQRPFSSVLEEVGVASMTSRFWHDATSSLKAKLSRAAQDRGFRKQLVSDCPRVIAALSSTADKVGAASRPSRAPGLTAEEREVLVAAADDIKSEFLAESIRRVTDPVDMMIPEKLLASMAAGDLRAGGAAGGGTEGSASDELPTSHDVKRYVQLLSGELERCEACPDALVKDVGRGVKSSIVLFATRLERAVDMACLEVNCVEEADSCLRLRPTLPLPAAGHARNARIHGIAHNTLLSLRDVVPARFQATIASQQVVSTLQQTQSLIASPMFTSLRRAGAVSIASVEHPLKDRSADGSPQLIALSQLCQHVARHQMTLFGPQQLHGFTKELCIHLVRLFLSAVVLVKPCSTSVREAMAQDMQALETALSALDADFQATIRHEASVFRECRRLVCTHDVESADFEKLGTVIPMHLLLPYLLHQMPEQIPSLPAFCGVSHGAYLTETMMGLWDAPPGGPEMRLFRSKIGEISDRFDFDPSSSTSVAFVMSQMG